jgi:hypothetical protein
MQTHITVNRLGLTYKGTLGVSAATMPDVCKTPSPGGPVPVPYPNFARQSSLTDGTTTVFAKGKMIAVKGSHYSRSNGDEAGTAGGVKSGVNMKATDWITYSFDVKMDGKNACRHTDKKFHNNKNTVDLQGNSDPGTVTPEALLRDIAKQCNDAVNNDEAKQIQNKKKKRTCQKLGQDKHKCCEEKIQDHRSKNPPDGDPKIEGETGYNRPKFDKKTKKLISVDKNPLKDAGGNLVKRGDIIKAAAKSAAGQGKKAIRAAIGKALGGTVWPDATIVGPPRRMVDFKFACPASHRKKNKRYRPPKQSPSQERAHNALGDAKTITILN